VHAAQGLAGRLQGRAAPSRLGRVPSQAGSTCCSARLKEAHDQGISQGRLMVPVSA